MCSQQRMCRNTASIIAGGRIRHNGEMKLNSWRKLASSKSKNCSSKRFQWRKWDCHLSDALQRRMGDKDGLLSRRSTKVATEKSLNDGFLFSLCRALTEDPDPEVRPYAQHQWLNLVSSGQLDKSRSCNISYWMKGTTESEHLLYVSKHANAS